jgi:D-methionine transport system ATP-binding protein
MVFQHFNLLSSRTAAGNIALPLEIAGAGKDATAARVDELLGLVGLSAQRDRYPSELSGGQKQRVGIARALAAKPKVLLCDEATSALDPETTAQILALLARIRRELGVTIVIITHEMAVVKAIADRVAVFDHGRLVEAGPTFEIFVRPQHPATRAFVSSVTGIGVPEDVRARLIDTPVPGGSAILRILFSGPHSGEPILSRLTQVTSADVNILAGQVDSIAGHPFGTFIVTVPSEPATLAAVQAALARLDLPAEILGYVA